MKKQLACALLSLSVIGINTVPAEATINIVESHRAQIINKEVCFYVPWLGRACFG